MKMERFSGKAKAEDLGAVALVLDLAKAFERVSLLVVWALGDALQLPEEDIAGALRILRAPEAIAVRRMCVGTALDHHGNLAKGRSEVVCFCALCVAVCVE